MTLLLVSIGLIFGTGFLAMLTGGNNAAGRLATRLAVGGVVAGSLLGLVPALAMLLGYTIGPDVPVLPWMTKLGGSFHVGLDHLSAFFVLLILGISALAAIYGSEYMQSFADKKHLGHSWFFFNLLVASMLMVVLARNGLLFLVAWELMALASYFLVTFESEDAGVCRSGWIYLVATHLGSTFLLVLFILLRDPVTGSLDFDDRLAGFYSEGLATAIFLLALVGFGTKAGLVPFYVWLPEAHAAAPSHVSALMSAVMIKLGIYGLLRTIVLLGAPQPWWGPALIVIGLLGGLIGIGQALYQRDLKRALAFSSVENIGLIALGIGIGLWGWSEGKMEIAVLGFAGALLHIWNHALMKGLMFFAAGSILHGIGSRDLEKLGGLMKPMPWTASLMILGATAQAALPPLNGFASEWLLYLGLLRAGLDYQDSRGLAALLAVGALATIGGLAAICFVRLGGIVCLGVRRAAPKESSPVSEHEDGHEVGLAMRGPMVLLAGLCVVSGLLPVVLLMLFSGVLDQILAGGEPLALSAIGGSLADLGWIQAGVWAAIGALAGLLVWLVRKNGATTHGTWDCGFVAPTPRMQYTGRSFAEFMAEHLLPRPFRPRISRKVPEGLFPGPSEFHAECKDPVIERCYIPLIQQISAACQRLWWIQHGTINLYLFYLMVLIFLGLGWMTVRAWLMAN